jgi:hypothetical protein
MAVCKKYRVEATNALTKHLLPEVGTCVDDNAQPIDFNMYRRAESLVAIVHRTTHVARTPDHGHAL